MEKWDALRTAYWVAQHGTVRAAAEHLGVHRATVVRHVDVLEAELGTKLFQRHGRGYAPTEAGQDLMRVAQSVDEQFAALAGRVRGREARVSGELVLTSIPLVVSMVMPALAAFRLDHPEVVVRYEASWRVFELEYGEAHVAIRVGAKPDHPDNVVRFWRPLQSALYAHSDYLDRHGWPDDTFVDHVFVSNPAPNTIEGWRKRIAPRSQVGFWSRDAQINAQAVAAGLGLGILPVAMVGDDPAFIQVRPVQEAWDVPLWLVTHVDLHWTAKVQAVLQALVGRAESDVSVVHR
ncbi:MAG: LysR family transcriptional regulator [Myxococcota bacterium]